FLGRADEQVKIRGHRVEPGEVEAVLARCDGVGRAVVVTADGADGRPELLGYVTARERLDPPDPAALIRALRTTMPEYMVPRSVTVLDAVPVLANGKLDRARLPRPAAVPAPPHVPPGTPGEKAVRAAVAEALGVREDSVGMDDDVFAAGLDSLGVMALVGRLRAEGRDVPPREVLESATVRHLADRFTSAPPAADTVPPAFGEAGHGG